MAPDSAQATVSASSTSAPTAYIPTTRSEIIKVVVAGVLAGLLIPLIGILIEQYILAPVFCAGDQNQALCTGASVWGNHIAALVVGVVGFLVLTQWMIYRALLLVVAVTISMWGLAKYGAALTTGSWGEYFLFSALLYGLGYITFYWILRLRNFVASLVLTILAVVAACWAIAVW